MFTMFILILASLNVLQAYRLTKSQWSPADSFPPTLQKLQHRQIYNITILQYNVIAAAATSETGMLTPCMEVLNNMNRQWRLESWRRWRAARMETYPIAGVAAVSTVNWTLQAALRSGGLPTVFAVAPALCAETEQRAEGVYTPVGCMPSMDAVNESVYTPAWDLVMCCAKPVGTHVWPSCAYMLMRKRRESCCTAKNSNHSKQKETQLKASGCDCSSGYNCLTLRLIVQGIPASVIKELPPEFAMVYSMLARMQ